jgi:hypothetical protein
LVGLYYTLFVGMLSMLFSIYMPSHNALREMCNNKVLYENKQLI